MIEVTLTQEEFDMAAEIGRNRQRENLEKRRKPVPAAIGKDGFALHVMGAVGEFAFAKGMGLKWTGAKIFRARDVEEWEVRCAKGDRGRLILQDRDHDDRRYALVQQIDNLHYLIVGWILGRDGKVDDFWWEDAPTPNYFVPLKELTAL